MSNFRKEKFIMIYSLETQYIIVGKPCSKSCSSYCIHSRKQRAKLAELAFSILFSPGPQPTGWCYIH